MYHRGWCVNIDLIDVNGFASSFFFFFGEGGMKDDVLRSDNKA